MTQRHAINFSWLLKLRWGAAGGQTLIILAVSQAMAIRLPLGPLFGIIAVAVVSNLAGEVWMRRGGAIAEWMLSAVMMLDVVLLTAMLYLTGGPLNPFSFLYLVNIALAAVVLPAAWTWTLTAFSLGCFGGLFLDHWPLDLPGAHDHGGSMHLHLQGMWVAFGVAAGFIVYFMQRVTRALAAQETALAAERERAARSERLASLATLAAGAAHELGTPLSTIAVVSKELERQLARGRNGADAADDARLIREQVDRCRAILDQLAADAGETVGETSVTIGAATLVERAAAGLADAARLRVRLTDASRAARLELPPRAVERALRGILENALEASPPGREVEVAVATAAERFEITVRDAGPGMPAAVLARAGEPFFTTKAHGMGLGLFLARAVSERLGGSVDLTSVEGRGTVVRMRLPIARAAAAAPRGPRV